MPTNQGDLALLDDPIAQGLLHSSIPARLAYIGRDGTPRVVPMWFHWNGSAVVLATALPAPKIRALATNPKVALSIDATTWPYQVLQIRGTAQVESVEGVVPEYAVAAERYFGAEQGRVWVEQVRRMFSRMARITVQPEWVGILDFVQRFPSAIEAALSGQ